MAPRKAVKAKRKPRKQTYEIIDVTDLRINGIPVPHESFTWDASPQYFTGNIVALDRELLASLFDVPVWLLGGPVNPITRSAHELKAAAGPGPYHCNNCGETYGFYHPPCKPKPVLDPSIKYLFTFDEQVPEQELENVVTGLLALGVQGAVLDRPCHIYKMRP